MATPALGDIPDDLPSTTQSDSLQEDFLRRVRRSPITFYGWLFVQGHASFEEQSRYYQRTFDVPRAQLGVRGTFPTGFSYKAMANFAREPNITDAMIAYKSGKHLNIRAGILKPFLNKDFVANPARTDLIDRSYTSRYFIAPREIGVDAEFAKGSVTAWVGLYNGDRISVNRDDAFLGTARLQLTPTLSEGHLNLGVFGLHGVHDNTPLGIDRLLTARGSRSALGADLSVGGSGWVLKTELLAMQVEEGANQPANTYGAYMATASWSPTDTDQLLVRVEGFARLEQAQQGSLPVVDRSQVTLGWNRRLSPLFLMKANALTTFPASDGERVASGLVLQLQMDF